MNLQPILSKLYPTGSFGGQCFGFLHKLVKQDSSFPGMPISLESKKVVLWQSGIPISKAGGLRIGDVVLFDYGYFGHGAIVNQILGNFACLTESNYSFNLKVTHFRTVELTDPHILGVFRGTPLYPLPPFVIRVKLVQNSPAWASMAQKFADIRQRILTASQNRVDINIDVDYTNFTDIPFVYQPDYPQGFGIKLDWLKQNIAPHGTGYHAVCFLVPHSVTQQYGLSFGWCTQGSPQLTQVFADENEVTTSQYLSMNTFVNAFIHENVGHVLSNLVGGPDNTHTYLLLDRFDLPGFFNQLDYDKLPR